VAVIAACRRGAIGWGSLSAVSGAMVSRYGMWMGFSAYLLLSVPCVYCAWHMEFKLGAKHADNKQQQQHQQQELDSIQVQKGAAPAASRDMDSAGSTAVGLMKVPDLQQQHDDELQHVDQCEQHNVEQQHLLQRPNSAPGNTADQRQQQQQELGQLQALDSKAVQQRQHQHLQRHDCRQQQEQQVLYSTAAGTADDADACVLLLHSNESATASRQGLQQAQHVDRPRQDVHVHSSCSSTGEHQGDAASLQNQQQQQQQQAPVDFLQGLQQLLSSPAVLIFMWQAVVMGFGIGGCPLLISLQ
jgi:hypothetical protein